jgi:hypothetical protein
VLKYEETTLRNTFLYGPKSILNKEILGVNVFSKTKRSDPNTMKTPSPFQGAAISSNKISPFGVTPSSTQQQLGQQQQSGGRLGFNSLSALKSFSKKSRSPKVTPHVSPSGGMSSTKSKFLNATRQTKGAQGALGALMAARQLQNQRSRFADAAGKAKGGRSARILPKSKIRRRMSSRKKKQTKFQKIWMRHQSFSFFFHLKIQYVWFGFDANLVDVCW